MGKRVTALAMSGKRRNPKRRWSDIIGNDLSDRGREHNTGLNTINRRHIKVGNDKEEDVDGPFIVCNVCVHS